MPAAWWLLVVRRGLARPRTVVAVVLASLFAARLVLPPAERESLRLVRYLVSPLELALIAWAVVKVRRASRRAAALRDLDVPERLAAVLEEGLPYAATAHVLATEMSLFYYALLSWRREPHVPAGTRAFTYHRQSALAAILVAVAGMSVVELFAVHLVLRVHHHVAAWIVTAISVLGVVWIVGYLRAVLLRPILVSPDALVVRTGVQWRLTIPRHAIARVEVGRPKVPPKRTPGHLRAVPVGQPNVLLTLLTPLVAEGPYGIRRTVTSVALTVDAPRELERELREDS